MKKALITGGAKRIGAEIAKYLSQTGYEIIIHYNTAKEDAENISKLYGAKLIQADFNNPDSITKLIDQDLDLLINNASMFKNDNILDFEESVFIQQQIVNFYTPIKLIQQLVIKNKPCQVINILDAWALSKPRNFLSYTISKNELYHFTRNYPSMLSNNVQVKVNGILLGAVLFKECQSQKIFDDLKEKFPTSLQDIFDAINLLLSDNNLNGKVIDCTNGNHIT
jgi:pteridine reductase